MTSTFPLSSSRIRTEHDMPAIRQRTRAIAELFGLDSLQQTRLATAVSEITRNALSFAGGGTAEFLVLVEPTQSLLVVRVRDTGSGITNLARLLEESGRGQRTEGGIPGSRRLLDRFSLSSSSAGTVVDLGMILSRHMHPVSVEMVNQAADQLVRAKPASSMDALEQQNREIMQAMTELRTHQEALEQADRRKNEFLAMLAHELRNPLAALQNGVEYMRSERNTPAPWRRVEDMMLRQTQQLSRLVDDLLDVSRITQGTVRIQRQLVEAAMLASMAAEANRALMSQRGHRFNMELPDEPIWLDADPTRLTQALSNLLNNAARYTGEGGVISLALTAQNGEACFTVRDNGLGIEADMLPRVFDLFTRAEEAIQATEAGLGIGLTIVRRMIELHGGHVTAHSDGPGRGSTFCICLPQREGPVAPAPAMVPTAVEAVTRDVLIVDDNADSAESLAMLLELYGYVPEVASDGMQALEKLAVKVPQVAILDIGMPGMDGYEVARRIRAMHPNAPILLIALTGFGDEATAIRAKEAGFNHRLVKPLDLRALQAVLGPDAA